MFDNDGQAKKWKSEKSKNGHHVKWVTATFAAKFAYVSHNFNIIL